MKDTLESAMNNNTFVGKHQNLLNCILYVTKPPVVNNLTQTSSVSLCSCSRQVLFTKFSDMQKAFDWLDRDLLLYKLLNYGIYGQIYNAVKQLYSQNNFNH